MILNNKNEFHHKKVQKSLKYIYGFNKYELLKKLDLEFRLSKKVNKIKEVKYNKNTLFTFRNNGTIALTLEGAKKLSIDKNMNKHVIKVEKDVEDFIKNGKSIFCKHIIYSGNDIRPKKEVIILSHDNKIISVGTSILPGRVMKKIQRGVAIKNKKHIKNKKNIE